MKILVICQYYYPEPFRITDICEELVKRGHEVTVVTGTPNYPMGEIYEGYREGEKRDEMINGVKVHRCFTIGRKHGSIYRFLNYYSYAFSSTSYVKKLKEEFDVVFVNQLSPVMMSNAGIKYKKKHNKKLVLYCLDLWTESLVVGGVKRESLIYNYFHKVSEKIYKQVDKILISSKSFSEYFFKEFGIRNTEYLPQYAEALFTPEQCKKEPDEYIDLMFAGNLGVAQNVYTIIEAARLTQDVKNLRWHIVGDGSEYENLKEQADDLPNVLFYGRKPLEEIPKYYAMADAMLVTLNADPVLSLTLPGKVQSYMAVGKPLIGSIDGETAEIIKEADCGYCSKAEDVDGLVKNIKLFINSDHKEQIGINARNFYESHFIRNRYMDTIERKLTEV